MSPFTLFLALSALPMLTADRDVSIERVVSNATATANATQQANSTANAALAKGSKAHKAAAHASHKEHAAPSKKSSTAHHGAATGHVSKADHHPLSKEMHAALYGKSSTSKILEDYADKSTSGHGHARTQHHAKNEHHAAKVHREHARRSLHHAAAANDVIAPAVTAKGSILRMKHHQGAASYLQNGVHEERSHHKSQHKSHHHRGSPEDGADGGDGGISRADVQSVMDSIEGRAALPPHRIENPSSPELDAQMGAYPDHPPPHRRPNPVQKQSAVVAAALPDTRVAPARAPQPDHTAELRATEKRAAELRAQVDSEVESQQLAQVESQQAPTRFHQDASNYAEPAFSSPSSSSSEAHVVDPPIHSAKRTSQRQPTQPAAPEVIDEKDSMAQDEKEQEQNDQEQNDQDDAPVALAQKAQPPPALHHHPKFGKVDSNGDGFIDGIEFQNAIARGVIN